MQSRIGWNQKATIMIYKDYKLQTAGFIMLCGVAFTIVWVVISFTGVIDPKSIFRFIWVASPLPYLGLASAFGDNSILATILILIFMSGLLASCLGGVLTIIKKSRVSAMLGGIGTLISIPILGIIVLLILRSNGLKAPK